MTKLKSDKKLNLASLGIVPEKLIEDNFMSWRNCLKNYFVGNGLWGVVSGNEIEPNKENRQEHEEWKKKNALALHAIQLSCGQAIFSKFKNADITAHHVWTHLPQKLLPIADDNEENQVQDNGSRVHLEPHHLYNAIVVGNWHSIEDNLRENPGAIREIISSRGDTALHIATFFGQTEIAEKLVKYWMEPEDLELKNESGATALSLAAIYGAMEPAKDMVSKNEELVTIETAGQEDGQLPVIMAALYGQENMARYLYSVTPDVVLSPEKGNNGVTLLNCLISAEIYDVALLLLKKYPKLGVIPDGSGNYALKILAQRPSAFLSGAKLAFWERLIYYCWQSRPGSYDKEHAEIQIIIESSYVDMTERWAHGCLAITTRALKSVRKLGWGILQTIAPKINHIYQRKLVHVQRVNGAALQMQRELQWFKEIESIVQPKLKEERNSYKKTPKMLFSDEHEKLAKEAEDWMKNTAGSSMIVGALIAAVMFTTAFTVPGGNKNDTGMPTMLETQRIPFLIFVISNALSMFSSSTSLLIFLAILTARYAEEDFLTSLPTKLISGLTCLFLSIVTMMASFGAALYLILHEKLSWVTVPIIVLTTIPIVLFSRLEFPLLIEMINRTYGAGIFDKHKKKSRFAKSRACLVWRNLLRKKRN